MASIIAKRYGKALFDLAKDTVGLETMQADADWLGQTWQSQPELRDMLLLPSMPREEKKRVMKTLTEGSISQHMLGLLYLLIDKGRVLYLPEILKEYERLRMQEMQVAKAEVTSAAPLSAEELSGIRQALEKALSCEVLLEVRTDANLIGGLVVRVGDQIFDNSLRTKLQGLKAQLLQKKMNEEVVQ